MKMPYPLSLREVVAGQTYIEMVVWQDGMLSLEKHVFYGQPIRRLLEVSEEKIWWLRTRQPSHQNIDLDLALNFRSANGLGLIREPYDNHHRVFRSNMRNEKILSDLVERQALKEYLKLIGIADPDAVIEKKRKFRPAIAHY